MKEEWGDVVGYKGRYTISNLGRIRSLKGHTKLVGGIMKPYDSNGYKRINLYKNGDFHRYKIHRLVAQTFIQNSKNKPCVNHKNGIKTDNRIRNLEWCTYKENQRHAFRIGICSHTGEKNPRSKLTKQQVKHVRKLYATGKFTFYELGHIYNVHPTTISDIVNKRNWKHI